MTRRNAETPTRLKILKKDGTRLMIQSRRRASLLTDFLYQVVANQATHLASS